MWSAKRLLQALTELFTSRFGACEAVMKRDKDSESHGVTESCRRIYQEWLSVHRKGESSQKRRKNRLGLANQREPAQLKHCSNLELAACIMQPEVANTWKHPGHALIFQPHALHWGSRQRECRAAMTLTIHLGSPHFLYQYMFLCMFCTNPAVPSCWSWNLGRCLLLLLKEG